MAWFEDYKQNVPSDRNLQRSRGSFLIWAYLALRVKSQNMMLPNEVKIPLRLFFSSPFLYSKPREPEVQVSKLREERKEIMKKPTTMPSLNEDDLPETGPREKRFNSKLRLQFVTARDGIFYFEINWFG